MLNSSFAAMRNFKRTRGFFTMAQNNSTTDYLRLAYALALSLRATQTIPYLSVGVTPGTVVSAKYRAIFDEVIELPWNDMAETSQWKLENEWKSYHITPYEETIKLDADMLFFDDIDMWWDILATRQLWFATTAMTYRGEVITNDIYRQTFTANDLTNIYTAFMFFRITPYVQELFELVEEIFRNYKLYSEEYLDETRPDSASTDVVFALALKLLNLDDHSEAGFPTFVHMKSRLQNWNPTEISEDWTRHIGNYLTSDLQLKIGRHRQLLPFHYHIKEFITDDMISRYERFLGL